jgi:nucleoside permease NupC
MRGVLGFFLLLALAWALRERRGEYGRRIPWRTVIAGVALQIGLAVLLLRLPPASRVLLLFNRAALALQEATDQGTSFVFAISAAASCPSSRPLLALASSSPSRSCRWCLSSARSPRSCTIGVYCSG